MGAKEVKDRTFPRTRSNTVICPHLSHVGMPGPRSGSIPDGRENLTDKSAPAPRDESEVAVV